MILLILYVLAYILVSYLTIYRLHMTLTNILRILIGLGLILFVYAAMMHTGVIGLWITALAAALVMTVEITSFKHSRHDAKGTMILNIFSAITSLLLVVLFGIYN